MSNSERYLRQYIMTELPETRARITNARLASLFFVFFLIACGLGYPILNRFDPRATPGLSDVKIYAAIVTGTAGEDAGHVRFRVLVPYLARPFYRIARDRVATWDPVMFGLLVVDSFFVAGTAMLIVVLGNWKLSSGVGLLGALLYLVNFAVPNLRLVGLVDAGEGFFLLALLLALSESELWALPLICALGALTKESFIPFSVGMSAVWWLTTRTDRRLSQKQFLPDAAWIVLGWTLSLATMIGVQWTIVGCFVSPLEFGLGLHAGQHYVGHLIASLHDRNLWYIFLWLFPTAIPNLKRLPKTWLLPVGAACVMVFVLDTYFGGAPGTVGRALFSVAGPVLSLSSSMFLLQMSS